VVPISPGVYAASSPTVNMSPSISGKVNVGSRISSGGVLVKYKRWSASSAPCRSPVSEASPVERETILGIQPSLTNSRSLPRAAQCPNRRQQQRQVRWSVDQSLLVILRRPVNIMVIKDGFCHTYLETGFARPNLATVSVKATFGSRNFSILRRSTSRPRKNWCANFRAEENELRW
jgi:hypothetical protein